MRRSAMYVASQAVNVRSLLTPFVRFEPTQQITLHICTADHTKFPCVRIIFKVQPERSHGCSLPL